MKNKIIRTFTVTLAAVLCLTAFSTTAFAGGTDPNPEPLPETTEAPQEEEPTTGGMEPEGVPVTPEGNATLVDDFYGDKQLITVTTKAGNYFYILIDRANEDKETAVHFLNQVDDADLQALLEDGEAEPEACTCAEKCEAGAVNTACPVCKNNLTACVGAAAGGRGTGRNRRAGGRSRKQHGRPDCVPCGAAHWRRRGPLLLQV